MMDLGILRCTDGLQLASLCDACSIMIQARRAMESIPPGEHGIGRLLVKSGVGRAVQNPLIGIVNRQKLIIARLAGEFGMTPAARARLMAGDIVEPAERGRTLEDIMGEEPMSDMYSEPPRPN